MTIDAYLQAMAKELRRHGPLALRPLAEIREHLRDRAQALVEDGLDHDEAEREATRRFGSRPQVAAELSAALDEERDPVERILKIISLSNLFIALWGLAAVLLLNHQLGLVLVTGLVAAAAVPTAWTVFHREVEPATLLVCGAACITVGSAGVLWALIRPHIDLAPRTGLVLLMVLFVTQGALALWDSARRRRLDANEPSTA